MSNLDAAEKELAELESQLRQLSEEPVPSDVASPGPDTPPEPEPVKDADYWKAEYQKIEAVKNKRDKDLEKGLHTTLQEKSSLEKELESVRNKASEVDALKAEIERLRTNQVPEVMTLDPDFEDSYPDIAVQIKGIAARIQSTADQRLDELRKEITSQRDRIEAERKNAVVQEHFLNVQAVHADASEYFDPNKLGGAIQAWASSKAEVVENILNNPAAYKPQDVAWVISEFKKEVGLTTKHKPVTGDISIKTGHATQVSNQVESDELTGDEIKHYDRMLEKAKNISDPEKRSKALNDLERKLTNSMFKTHN